MPTNLHGCACGDLLVSYYSVRLSTRRHSTWLNINNIIASLEGLFAHNVANENVTPYILDGTMANYYTATSIYVR